MPRHFGLKANIGSPTDRASNGIDPREHPECIDVCAKDPSSGQFCGVKALFPILGAAFVAGELAGRPCSTINLSTLTINLSTLCVWHGKVSKSESITSNAYSRRAHGTGSVERYDAHAAAGPVASNRSYLRGSIDTNVRWATESAPRSLVSRAIFCASITSPATRLPSGTKHHLQTRCPVWLSSSMLVWVPWCIR